MIPYLGRWGWNCSLRRLPNWSRSRHKKIGLKMLKSSILKQQKHNTPQKKAKNNCHSDLKSNYRILLWKSWKKKDFVIFSPKKSWLRLGLGWISGKPAKIQQGLEIRGLEKCGPQRYTVFNWISKHLRYTIFGQKPWRYTVFWFKKKKHYAFS